MAIIYYPNRIFKGKVPAIDREMAKRKPKKYDGQKDVTAEALDAIISSSTDWQVDSVLFQFSAAAPRDYSVKVLNGRRVVTDLNDYLWFEVQGQLWQRIILSDGFYTGTQLATELETQLNANAAFSAAGITFTVVYAPATGLFTVTPSSGTIRYLDVATSQTIRYRDSIAGHLFGFTTTGSFAATAVSDTPVYGLGTEAQFIDVTAGTALEHFHDDIHTLDVDQALHIEVGVAALTVNYSVVYEEIV